MSAKAQAEMHLQWHKQALAASSTVFPRLNEAAMTETCQYRLYHCYRTSPRPWENLVAHSLKPRPTRVTHAYTWNEIQKAELGIFCIRWDDDLNRVLKRQQTERALG